MHFLKLFRYINEAGGMAITPAVAEVKIDFGSFKEVFDLALESELQ